MRRLSRALIIAAMAFGVLSCIGGGEEDGGDGGGSLPSTIQLPIYVLYVNHVDAESVLPAGVEHLDGETYTSTAERYAFTKEMLTWETAFAESVGGAVSFHISGAFAERTFAAGDKAIWEGYIARGHSVGVNAQGFLRGDGQFEWTLKSTPEDEEIRKHWVDNHTLAASLVGAGHLWVGESQYYCPQCWSDLGYVLRTNERMALLPEGEHIVWRVERGLDGYITYPHLPQIGDAEYHDTGDGRVLFDMRIGHLKKEFLMLYVEWLARERRRLNPQLWAWGFANHGGDNTQRFQSEIVEALTWIRTNFIERPSPLGNMIVRFVNDHELKEAFELYEDAGGLPMPSPTENINDTFPYMAAALGDAGVSADLSDALGAGGVRVFELERRPPFGPEPAVPQKLYLLFREWGEADNVDLGGLLASRGVTAVSLNSLDVTNGSESVVPVQDMYMGYTPLVLEVPQ